MILVLTIILVQYGQEDNVICTIQTAHVEKEQRWGWVCSLLAVAIKSGDELKLEQYMFMILRGEGCECAKKFLAVSVMSRGKSFLTDCWRVFAICFCYFASVLWLMWGGVWHLNGLLLAEDARWNDLFIPSVCEDAVLRRKYFILGLSLPVSRCNLRLCCSIDSIFWDL